MNIAVIDESKNLGLEFARIAKSFNISSILVAEKYRQQKNQSVTVSTGQSDDLILINNKPLITVTERQTTADERNLYLEIKEVKEERKSQKLRHDWHSQQNRIPKYAK